MALMGSEEEEAKASSSFLLDLPAICSKCSRNLAWEYSELCVECYVEDEPDLDLIFRSDK